MSGGLETLSQHRCFGGGGGGGGVVSFHRHASAETRCSMRFAVFTPPGASAARRAPVLYYLAGLTCTEETFMIKAGAQRVAAELGLMLVAPDTSPRGVPLPGDSDAWDFGVGAGFYVDATEMPWSAHYRMESYIARELPALVAESFPADRDRQGIFGHSMGGHGALTLALKHPGRWKSVSALAPICAPTRCPWGEKAFTGYLGSDREQWQAHDATLLVSRLGGAGASKLPPVLVDQGLDDQFLDKQLHPHLLEEAAKKVGYPLTLRRHAGYDHGYYFVSTFMEDHLRHHARILGRAVSPLRVFELVAWFSLPTVMFGGFSLLRLLTRGQKLTPFQVTMFRAGHAHAGVLLVMALVFLRYLGDTTYGDGARGIICTLLGLGIILQSGGFFLHMAIGKEGEASWGTRLTMLGAALLAVAVLALGIGLAAYHA